MRMRWWREAAAVCFSVMVVGSASAWRPALTDERFQETGYGLSFLPPADGTLDPHPTDDSVAVWHLGERAVLRLRVKRFHVMIESLEKAMGLVWKESNMGLAESQPIALETERLRVADRPAFRQVATLQPQAPLLLQEHEKLRLDLRPTFFAQTAIQLGPHSVIMLELFAPQERAAEARRLLEQIEASAALAEPIALYELRKQAFQNAKNWLDTQDFALRAKAQPNDRWFLARRGGNSIGYARKRWWTDPEEVVKQKVGRLGQPGTVVGVYSMIRRAQSDLLTRHDAFLIEGGTNEVWSNVSTLTVTQAQGGGIFEAQKERVSWSETGLRNADAIEISTTVPPDADAVSEILRTERQRAQRGEGVAADLEPIFTRREGFAYIPKRLPASLIDGEPAIPPMDVFLSQVALALVPEALPKDRDAGFAFYAYDSQAGRVALRTYTVEVDEANGGAVVVERPT
ncbi:MAG: hypothetical protein AAF916_09515, partial [Planctomycetota bacterium]